MIRSLICLKVKVGRNQFRRTLVCIDRSKRNWCNSFYDGAKNEEHKLTLWEEKKLRTRSWLQNKTCYLHVSWKKKMAAIKRFRKKIDIFDHEVWIKFSILLSKAIKKMRGSYIVPPTHFATQSYKNIRTVCYVSQLNCYFINMISCIFSMSHAYELAQTGKIHYFITV